MGFKIGDCYWLIGLLSAIASLLAYLGQTVSNELITNGFILSIILMFYGSLRNEIDGLKGE